MTAGTPITITLRRAGILRPAVAPKQDVTRREAAAVAMATIKGVARLHSMISMAAVNLPQRTIGRVVGETITTMAIAEVSAARAGVDATTDYGLKPDKPQLTH